MSQRYTIARILREGERFEILVKPDKAFKYRMGKLNSINEILITDAIFTDANKGLRASGEKLKKAFGTIDPLKIADVILKKGSLQLTTEQRKQLIEEKRKQIITFISRNCVDPRTNLPHPPLRIEQAMKQIHFSIDPFKDVGEQAKEVIKLLRPFIPLRVDQVSVNVKVPPQYVAKIYGVIKGFGVIKHEEWRGNGSFHAIVEMPAGIYGPFLEKIGALTKGAAEAKIVK